MAQYETHLTGDFYALLHYIEKNVMQGSATASREGESTFETDGVRCAVRVYERYSWWAETGSVCASRSLAKERNCIFLPLHPGAVRLCFSR